MEKTLAIIALLDSGFALAEKFGLSMQDITDLILLSRTKGELSQEDIDGVISKRHEIERQRREKSEELDKKLEE